MDPLDIFAECKGCYVCQVSHVSLVLLSFSVIVLYNDTGIYTWLYFRNSAKLLKVCSSLSMSVKCFVAGIKSVSFILLLLVKSLFVTLSTYIIHVSTYETLSDI